MNKFGTGNNINSTQALLELKKRQSEEEKVILAYTEQKKAREEKKENEARGIAIKTMKFNRISMITSILALAVATAALIVAIVK